MSKLAMINLVTAILLLLSMFMALTSAISYGSLVSAAAAGLFFIAGILNLGLATLRILHKR